MSNILMKSPEYNEELKIVYTTTNKKCCKNEEQQQQNLRFGARNTANALKTFAKCVNSELPVPPQLKQNISHKDELKITNVCNECDIESSKRDHAPPWSTFKHHRSHAISRSTLHNFLLRTALLIVCLQVCVHVVDALFVNEAINDGPFLSNKNDMSFLNLNETNSWDTFAVPAARKGPFMSAFEMKRSSKTTKRSVTDIFLPHLTTVATPLLTTMRYLEKSHHQKQINLHHRNYELDLERDHALPTSAPNADILKSNSNPTYPNPNRHHSHDRDRHRHLLNSTPQPSLPNILKKSNNQTPTIPMYPGEVPSYSPPARSFFTPPLPPEYQHPFADKPTLRGTNNDGIATNSASYINRRPIPPPSLMPGHERIPFRPPDMPANSGGGGDETPNYSEADNSNQQPHNASELDRKKVLNTPSHNNSANSYATNKDNSTSNLDKSATDESMLLSTGTGKQNQEVLPSIRRILSGSNGKNGEIPEVLLKQVTQRPDIIYHHPPSSPVVLLEGINREQNDANEEQLSVTNSNKLNSEFNASISNNVGSSILDMSSVDPRTDQTRTKITNNNNNNNGLSSTPTHFVNNNEVLSDSSTYSTTLDIDSRTIKSKANAAGITPSSSTVAANAAAHATWTMAWNTHVYLSVILFTVIAVYSIYKMLTYNKLTHLFSQSYFVCIHLILIIICSARIFYLCYDAYNVHGTFHIFVSEILLNLPATMLSTAFAVLILYLFLKSLNHKNNRYSALIRPLTVVVGCGVHVVLCITLHYVESYTMQNQQQQQTTYYQQQQQQQFYRKQQQQHYNSYQYHESASSSLNNNLPLTGTNQNMLPFVNYNAQTPPRVLSLICQIIYIFVCLSLGLLYLYLYRILKRILRSKSQNYIHGYQNLSYAIHITIATALLFVLLAALQIFGVISISTNRPIIAQVNAEIDWLQWGYQFSLRLIEIAIVTLISWVASLKTSNSSNMGVGGTGQPNGNVQMSNVGPNSTFGVGNREKTGYNHQNHSNMAGFFLPCTSSSSQEQFETDYPAVCNANTNLHTYTMRTGKLIYDDSFVLNSLARGSGGQTAAGIGRMVDGGDGGDGLRNDFQIQQPTYQHPYDTGSLHSSKNHNISEYGSVPGEHHRYHHHHHHQSSADNHHYSDYLTDATTDHYENPNFDLRGPQSNSDAANSSSSQKFVKTSTASTNASSIRGSGGSMSASQQQMLLLQNDNCYSEPMTEGVASNLNFNNFERPNFSNGAQKSLGNSFISKSPMGYWPEQQNHAHGPPLQKSHPKQHNGLSRTAFDNPERSSSNSNHSMTSNGGIGRYGANGYNSFDRNHYNKSIRKSGTLSNFGLNGMLHGQNVASATEATTNSAAGIAQRPLGVQTLTAMDRYHHHNQRSSIRNVNANANPNSINDNNAKAVKELNETDALFSRGAFERNSDQCAIHNQIKSQYQQHQHQTNSDDDDILSGSNVECTNLINNEDGSYITNSSSTNSACGGNLTDQGICSNSTNSDHLLLIKQQQQQQQKLLTSNKTSSLHSHAHVTQNHSSGHDTASASSSNSGAGTPSDSIEPSNVVNTAAGGGGNGSMLVAEHGFVRFRAIDDMNNAQGVGIHNASIRNKNRNSSSLTST